MLTRSAPSPPPLKSSSAACGNGSLTEFSYCPAVTITATCTHLPGVTHMYIVTVNDGNLELCGVTLTYLEMIFLNSLNGLLLAYVRSAITINFVLIGSLQQCYNNYNNYNNLKTYAVLHYITVILNCVV